MSQAAPASATAARPTHLRKWPSGVGSRSRQPMYRSHNGGGLTRRDNHFGGDVMGRETPEPIPRRRESSLPPPVLRPTTGGGDILLPLSRNRRQHLTRDI